MSENGITASSWESSYPLPYETPSYFHSLPAALPTLSASVSSFPASSELEQIASGLLTSLQHTSIGSNDSARVFAKCNLAIFRDTFALTSTLRTFYSVSSILTAWQETTSTRRATDFVITPGSAQNRHLGGDVGWVDVRFTFTCQTEPRTLCEGWLSIVPEAQSADKNGSTAMNIQVDAADWKIWLIRTVLVDLEHTSPLSINFLNPISADTNGTNGIESTPTVDCVDHQVLSTTTPSALILGAGPSGLSLSSRFLALHLPHLVLSRDPPSAGIGSSWKIRYDSAKLHTIREYSHLPYERTFSGDRYENREWMTKDDLAGGYAGWAKRMGVDQHVRLGWEVVHASWITEKREWEVQIRFIGEGNTDTETEQSQSTVNSTTTSPITTLTTKHIILATGPGSHHPSIPPLTKHSLFRGIALHSASYTSSKSWTGLHGLIIGTANTAHDVAEDMLRGGLASVTMLQRRTTYVLPTEYFSAIAARSYNADVPTEEADKAGGTMPWAISRLMAMRALHARVAEEEEKGENSRFERLSRAGYAVERKGDIMWHIVERMGGHYMDVGNCENIASEKVKVKHGVPMEWRETGLVIDTGKGKEEIRADVVVFATGFERGGKRDVERMFDGEVADQCEEYWGLDEEGEVRGAWKGSGHPGLWYHGGTLGHGRYMSRFIALKIRAELDGKELPVYSKKV
jgi:cation diffusion facilitator CzcD-associated flavoprotein CzcO